MIVDGHVIMSISMNVIGLETDAVEYDRFGNLKIVNPDQFFIDWDEEWNNGNGELLGASELSVDIEGIEEEDDEYED